jgi:hypothetical protein
LLCAIALLGLPFIIVAAFFIELQTFSLLLSIDALVMSIGSLIWYLAAESMEKKHKKGDGDE